jgi:hypothetical protein
MWLVRASAHGLEKAHLFLHALRGHGDNLGGRVLHFNLGNDGGRIVGDEEFLEVIDDHFVHACDKDRRVKNPAQCRASAHAPFGPNEVRVICESSLHAVMLRRTASSIPENVCAGGYVSARDAVIAQQGAHL